MLVRRVNPYQSPSPESLPESLSLYDQHATCTSKDKNVICTLPTGQYKIWFAIPVVVTSRVCGRGIVYVCVCVFVPVCVSVWAIIFEPVDTETSVLVWWYILTYLGQVQVKRSLGQCQGPVLKNVYLTTWTSV